MNPKRKIYLMMKNVPGLSALTNIAMKLNLMLFHFDERKQRKHYGSEDPEKTYYVIRSRGRQEGLLSTYYYVMNEMKYAVDKGYVPVVDFSTDLCQYHIDALIDGTNNAWEYYFKQPLKLKEAKLNQKKNVVLNGWTFGKISRDHVDDEWKRKFFDEMCPIKANVQELADEKYQKLFATYDMGGGGILGVFLRGTDYVSLRPKGHHVQPTVEQLCDKIDDFLKLHVIKKIYVVTEDYEIYLQIQNRYGSMVFSADDNFVKEYNQKDYLESSLEGDAYTRGRDYLVRLILLGRCDYLISSLASGSEFVLDYKKDEYKDRYLFDLGLYS